MLNSIISGPVSAPNQRQDLEYAWDRAGNLISRQDHNQSLVETFEYDDLHRLTEANRNSVSHLAITYASNGNILSQSGLGTYTYAPTKLHAVASIAEPGGTTQRFAYDANGNMTDHNGMELLWFADNRPKRIRNNPASASNSSEFQYGPDGQRWYHKINITGTIYTHVNLGGIFEIVTKGAIDDFRHTIHANGVPIALTPEIHRYQHTALSAARSRARSTQSPPAAGRGAADELRALWRAAPGPAGAAAYGRGRNRLAGHHPPRVYRS